MTTRDTLIANLPKAYCGFRNSDGGKAYVEYSGNLTKPKLEAIEKLLESNGYYPGWKSTNVRIKRTGYKLFVYKEDGGSGLLSSIEVFHLQGDR